MEPLKDAGKYDSAFLGILQSVGKIEPFMDHIFSFLRTRTDFYVITNPENQKMGFAPGVAESIVQTVRITDMLTHTNSICMYVCFRRLKSTRYWRVRQRLRN